MIHLLHRFVDKCFGYVVSLFGFDIRCGFLLFSIRDYGICFGVRRRSSLFKIRASLDCLIRINMIVTYSLRRGISYLFLWLGVGLMILGFYNECVNFYLFALLLTI